MPNDQAKKYSNMDLVKVTGNQKLMPAGTAEGWIATKERLAKKLAEKNPGNGGGMQSSNEGNSSNAGNNRG